MLIIFLGDHQPCFAINIHMKLVMEHHSLLIVVTTLDFYSGRLIDTPSNSALMFHLLFGYYLFLTLKLYFIINLQVKT